MSKPVTDPDLIKALNGTLTQEPVPVSDPALLAQLNASIGGGDAEAQAGGFYGPAPVQGQMRRQIQRRAMAGLEPTPQQQAAIEADKPAREQRTADFVNTMAPVAAMPLMPMGTAGLPLGRALLQGVPLGAATGYVGGFLGGGTDAPTVGDHLAARHEAGTTGAMLVGALGAGIPLAVAGISAAGNTVNNLLSPVMARMRPNAFADDAAAAMPASAGAAVNPIRPPPLPPITGPEAAAYQHIANRLSSAGVRPADLAQRLERADVDSFAGNPRMGMVDLDPSLQRLAGSVVRQNQEAGNIGQRFMAGRQTGITPLEGMPDPSIPTRPYMAAASPIDAPMGQFERMRETVRSALQVPPRSAYRVDQDLVEGARTEANRLYGDAYRMAQGVDVRSAIEPVLQRWAATAASADTPRPMAALITRALRNFQSGNGEPVQSLRSFQRSKEFLDDTIETLVNSANGKQRARAGMLGEIQRDLLAAVDSIPNVGAAYSTARGAFSSRMQMRGALEAGRNAFREGAEVSADAYRAYGPGEQQMFRIGLADAIERQMAGQKRGADVTQLFQNPRMQELLQEVMPQDTARRLGGVIQTENAMTRSNNVVFGNSATAQRMADDQAFNQMSDVLDTLRANRSVTSAALNYTAKILDKALGFRADEATQIARTLFTADRGSIDDALAQIARRMGANKADQFAQMMRAYQMRVVPTAAGAVGAAQQPAPRRREYTVTQQQPGGSRNLPPDPKPMPPSR